MKDNLRKILGILLIVGLATGCGCSKEVKEEKKEETGIKVNVNQDVVKDQKLEVFTFTNTSLIYENGTSVLETIVTNTSNETQYLEEFDIIVKNDKGEEIITMTGFVGDSIAAQQSTTILSTYGDDLSKAYAIEYTIKR